MNRETRKKIQCRERRVRHLEAALGAATGVTLKEALSHDSALTEDEAEVWRDVVVSVREYLSQHSLLTVLVAGPECVADKCIERMRQRLLRGGSVESL